MNKIVISSKRYALRIKSTENLKMKNNLDPNSRANELLLYAAIEGFGSESTEFDLVTGIIGASLYNYQFNSKNLSQCNELGKVAINLSAAILTRTTGNSLLYKKPTYQDIDIDENLILLIEKEYNWAKEYIGDNAKIALEQVAADFSVEINDEKTYKTIMNLLFYVENVII